MNVIITDQTITGGDMLYEGLSLAEARSGVLYAVEPEPGGSSGYPNTYVVGDILGNVSDRDHGVVVTGSSESDGDTWYRVRFGAARSGDRWMLDDYVYNFDSFTWSLFDRSHMRRVAHADPHTVIVNDTMTNTGDIGWYRLSLAEVLAGKRLRRHGRLALQHRRHRRGPEQSGPVHRRVRERLRPRAVALRPLRGRCRRRRLGRSRPG